MSINRCYALLIALIGPSLESFERTLRFDIFTLQTKTNAVFVGALLIYDMTLIRYDADDGSRREIRFSTRAIQGG